MLLISKVQYAQGDYQAALLCVNDAQLDQIHLDGISSRKLKIVSEAYAIKGNEPQVSRNTILNHKLS